jgi:hypothetical protein
MVMIGHRQHGLCGIIPEPITLTALAEKVSSVLES